MTRDRLITLIRNYLGFHNTLDEAIVLAHLELVQYTYEQPDALRPLPWFLFNPTHTLSLGANVGTITLPADFLDFDEDWPVKVTTSAGLNQHLFRKSDQDLDYNVSGLPCFFAKGNNTLFVTPKPLETVTITLPHYARSTPFGDATTSPWFTYFPRLIALETVASLAGGPMRDVDGKRTAENELGLLRAEYLSMVMAEKMKLRDITMNSRSSHGA